MKEENHQDENETTLLTERIGRQYHRGYPLSSGESLIIRN